MKIRLLNITDIIKLKKLTSHLDNDAFLKYKSELIFNPLSIINYILPSKFKFLQDSYIAIQDKNIKGMISLKPKNKNSRKWIIKKLLLDENCIESGEQLINFVVEKYASQGAETFEADINSENQLIIDLFSKVCKFRYCSDYQIYEIKTCYYKNKIINAENYIFRPIKPEDKKDLAELYNQNISPYYKFSLSKIPDEYSENFFKGLNNKTLFTYVFEDKFTKKIKGYIKIETEDNKCFVAEIILLQSYEDYFENMLTFAISQISKRANNFSLYLKNPKFHVNSDKYEKVLSEIDNELIRTDMIFVKDFFTQIKEKEETQKQSSIYNEINGKPAYKI